MTAPPMPPNQSARRVIHGLIVIILVATLCLAGYAGVQPADKPAATGHVTGQANPVMEGDFFAGIPGAQWPENVTASAMFQCWPATVRNAATSIMVWTDKTDRVVAFGASQEGPHLPAYATALADVPMTDASKFVHVAGQGYVMQTSGKKHTMQLGDIKLSCDRTWDD